MADPTTLLELATQKRDAVKAAQTQARQALTLTEQNLPLARKNLADTKATIVRLENEAAAIRDALAKVPTRADGDELLKKLEQKTIEQRAQQIVLLDSEQKATALEVDQKQAREQLALLTAALTEAKANVTAATTLSDRQKNAEAALGIAPLLTIQKDATDALANAVFLAAKKRIEGDIPIELLARAQARRGEAANRTAAPRELLELAEDQGTESSAAQFRRLEGKLEDYVARAKERFDRARARLASVADPTNSPLTPEQKARITGDALATPGKAAVTKEEDRDEKAKALRAKQLLLDEAVFKARHANIDADPAADTDVKDATTARNDAAAKLATAVAAYTATNEDDLNLWEAAVPDSTWRLLDDFEEAQATLVELETSAPSVTNLATAELAWVTALVAKEKEARTAQFLASEIAAHAATLAYEQDSAARRKFSALRGDSQEQLP